MYQMMMNNEQTSKEEIEKIESYVKTIEDMLKDEKNDSVEMNVLLNAVRFAVRRRQIDPIFVLHIFAQGLGLELEVHNIIPTPPEPTVN